MQPYSPPQDEIDLFYDTKRRSMHPGEQPHAVLFLIELHALRQRKASAKEARREVKQMASGIVFD